MSLVSVPYSFTPNTTIQSGQVNANNSALVNFINTYCAILNNPNLFSAGVTIETPAGLTVGSSSNLTPLNVTGAVSVAGTTSLGGNTSITGTLASSGLVTANGGVTVPSGQTATVAGTLDVTGSETVASSTITTLGVTGTTTLSGALNANGGMTVPSGQTATMAGTLSVTGSATVAGTLDVTGSETVASSSIGTLSVTGSATVPAATASGNPVQLAQVAQVEPITNVAKGNSAASSSTTTSVTFTAPTAGYVVGIAKLISVNIQTYTISFVISINGVNGTSDQTLLPMIEFQVVSVAAGEDVTVTAEATASSSGYALPFDIGVLAYFLPSP